MLQTDRLLLRPPTEDDVQSLFDIYGDLRTNAHNPHGPYPDMDTARSVLSTWAEHWKRYGFGPWAISTLQTSPKVIGYGGISFRKYLNHDKLNLGYRFGVESWGKGYATEFGKAALRHIFEELQPPEVFALVRPANAPSIRVLEKLGMVLIGNLNDVPGKPPSLIYRADKTSCSDG
jgi:[ribosomal protein S5]-alanine N-acetyltransferase